jgi:protein SCO1/2
MIQMTVPPPARGAGRVPLGLFLLWLAATGLWWALALAPVPASVPAWLAVTRAVCFGTGEDGLPAAYGWLNLIGGPLGWLAALGAVWGRDFATGVRTLAGSGSGRAMLALLAVLPLLFAGWAGQRVAVALRVSAALHGTDEAGAAQPYARLDRPAPAFRLLDQRGETVELAALRGRVVWLTFAFGHCETLCPLLVRRAADAARRAPELGGRLVIITLDPWRDTPASLPALAAHWNAGPGMAVLSGPVEAVNRVLDDYRVERQRDLRTGDIVHPGLAYVVDPQGRLFAAFLNPSTASLVQAARDAARVGAAPSPGG